MEASPEGAIAARRAGHGPSRARRREARASARQSRASFVEPGGGLAARLDAELVEDVGDVALDRVRAEVEGARDQLVAVAGGEARQHLALAIAEERHDRTGTGGRAGMVGADRAGRCGAA